MVLFIVEQSNVRHSAKEEAIEVIGVAEQPEPENLSCADEPAGEDPEGKPEEAGTDEASAEGFIQDEI